MTRVGSSGRSPPDAIKKAQEALFVEALRGKGIATLVKHSE